MEKLTLARALSELKLIDSKVDKLVTTFKPVAVTQKGKKILGVYTEEEFIKEATSTWDSINDHINRKNRIKKAIVLKNAETFVTIDGQSMTIADAITLKNEINKSIVIKNKIKSDLQKAMADVNNLNSQVDQNVKELLAVSFGKEGKPDKDAIESVTKPYREQNEARLVDPLGASKVVASMEDGIDGFLQEVDASLSEVNAVTFIEF